jgi:hypothetical protein
MSKRIIALLAIAVVSVSVAPAFGHDKDEGRKEGEACGGAEHVKCRAGLECVRNEQKPESRGVCKKPAAHPE